VHQQRYLFGSKFLGDIFLPNRITQLKRMDWCVRATRSWARSRKGKRASAAKRAGSWARLRRVECASAAEAGHTRGCRGETPRTPPAAGEVALAPLRSAAAHICALAPNRTCPSPPLAHASSPPLGCTPHPPT
jgi:hypothetical protein